MSANRYSPSRVQGAYPAPTADVPVHAELTIPGSKSLTNRELMIAAIADGPGRLIVPLHSDDSARMVDALRALGVGIEEVDAGNYSSPTSSSPPRSSAAAPRSTAVRPAPSCASSPRWRASRRTTCTSRRTRRRCIVRWAR